MGDNQKKPCTWPGCNKVFSCERAMRRHIYNVHQEVRRHKCPHCDKAFKTKYNLDDHIRTHTGEKPFECEYCGSRFAQNGSLVGHRKRCQKKIIQNTQKPSATNQYSSGLPQMQLNQGYTIEHVT